MLSRRALLATQQAETAATGVRVTSSFEHVFSAAFDRLVGGVVVALALLLVAHRRRDRAGWARAACTPAAGEGSVWTEPNSRLGRSLPDRAWFWVGANALFGPMVGVTSMVWALQTLQPGVTQAIAALAPLVAIPAARWLEGYRPPPGYWVGAVIAVLGLAGLALS